MDSTVARAAGDDIFQSRTTHASRTLMVADLATLLEAESSAADLMAYRRAVVEDNVLMRKSVSARAKSWEHLRAFYSFDERDAIFRAMRKAYEADPNSLPLLAMLCGVTRDLLLRSTAETVLGTAFGCRIAPGDLSAAVAEQFPGRFSSSNLVEIGRRTLSSWEQSGQVAGRANRVRDRAHASIGSIAFALYLGHLSGVRGAPLFETLWARLLDAAEGELDSLAFAASQRGLMEYRRMGGVVEFGFSVFEFSEDGANP